jgi:hypothetical protein
LPTASATRIARRLSAALLIALSLLLIGGSSSAMAVISGHVLDFEFGEEGTEGGKFGFSYAGFDVAVDSSTGDFYVTDPGNARVQKFDDEGNFLLTWGFGVKDGSNEFQVCEAPEACQQGIPGFAPGQFYLPAGVAVDNSSGPNQHRVYIVEVSGWYGQSGNEILKFSPDGDFEGSIDGSTTPLGEFTEPTSAKLEVDGEGYVWVGDREWPQGSRIMRFSNQPDNAYMGGSEWEMKYDDGGTLEPGPAFTMAPTPSGDAIYVNTWYQGNCCGLYRVVANGSAQRLVFPTDGGPTVFDYSNGHFFVNGMNGLVKGNFLAQEYDGDPVNPQPIGPPTTWAFPCCGLGGLALNSSTSTLYATALYQARVGAFKPRRVPETVTQAATEVLHTTATIHGHTAPDPVEGGPVSECHFEWGLTTTYENVTPCEPGGSIEAPTDVSLDLAGLAQENTYHFRLRATNSVGTEYGKDMTFTPRAVLSLDTEPASNVTSHSATLNASFETGGEDTEYKFEWGKLAANLNKSTPIEAVEAEPGVTAVSAPIEGLEDFTQYHFRISATNGFGTSLGPVVSFKTSPPSPPLVSGAAAENVTDRSAELKAMVNPNFGEVLYGFEYGENQAYGNQVISSEILGADNLSHPVGMDIEGLAPGKTYHFRALAINFGGITYGADQSFTTLDVPDVLTSGASAVSSRGARLEALINPGLSPTTVRFEYGTDVGYGSSTGSVAIGGGGSPVTAAIDVGGLNPGTTYHLRAIAANAIGSVDGPDQTFTTAPEATAPVEPTCGKGQVLRNGKCVNRPKRCKRGFVKRRGKCVKKKKVNKRKRHSTRGKRRSAK